MKVKEYQIWLECDNLHSENIKIPTDWIWHSDTPGGGNFWRMDSHETKEIVGGSVWQLEEK
jgi:hypothetical protein